MSSYADQDPSDPLAALQDAIQDLHNLMTVLPDPKDTAVVAQCLTALTRIQQDMMQNRGAGNPVATMLQQLQGGGGGGQAPQGAYGGQ